MLLDVEVHKCPQSVEVFGEAEPLERHRPGRRISARDLVEFGRCPMRWARTDDPEDWFTERGPSLTCRPSAVRVRPERGGGGGGQKARLPRGKPRLAHPMAVL
jgi:hypothetical protein